MLAWVMNLGFAASGTADAPPAAPSQGTFLMAQTGMGCCCCRSWSRCSRWGCADMDSPILLLVGLAIVVLVGVPITVYVSALRMQRAFRDGLRDDLVSHIDRKLAGDATAAEEYAQPRAAGEHDHVFGPSPFEQDSQTKSFRCQVPRCSRIQTQNLR
jgi:hypothetical protein